ncbi:hypothetical protein [Spirilliplanes yamanashiensis]|nr:hypothetical protein [Spirilliplanes yamanashiensis]MDP9815410.1 hypothetical protein [Spirilliplanes yamanashiensis]
MSSDAQQNTDAGSSTDQHVTGPDETGVFTDDQRPTGDTPIHGSSNAGVNDTAANRVASERELRED